MDFQDIKEVFHSNRTKNEKIAYLLEREYTRDDIMKIVGCSPNTKIKKSLESTGSIPDQLSPGRPSKKTPAVISFVSQQTISNPLISGKDLSMQLKSSLNVNISSSTINRLRGEIGFFFLPPLSEPKLSELQKQKRMNFCSTILLHRDDLPFIGFSDESRFCLGNDNRWVWRIRGQYNPETVVSHSKFAPSIMIWGLFGRGYKPDVFIFDETEKSENYCSMLEDNSYLLDAVTFYQGNFALQQDGARTHTAGYTMNYLIQKCDVIINWPTNSPDLNVIEMIWSLMKNIVAFYHPTNLQELIEAVQIAWRQISMETVNKLFDSFIKRCFLCLKNRGECINHLFQSKSDQEVTDKEVKDLVDQLNQDGIILEEIEYIQKIIE